MYTPMTREQRFQRDRLLEEVPEYNLTHLECPDCGDLLVLKASRYGRFYGCRTWKDTKCPGAVSARRDGRPLGIPINKEGRAARARVLRAFEQLPPRLPSNFISELSVFLGRDVFSIGTLDAQECEKTLRFLERYGAPKSVWSLLADDDEDVVDIMDVVIPQEEMKAYLACPPPRPTR